MNLIPYVGFLNTYIGKYYNQITMVQQFKFELTKHTFKRIRMGRTLSEIPRTQFPGDDVIRISMRDAESRLNRLI